MSRQARRLPDQNRDRGQTLRPALMSASPARVEYLTYEDEQSLCRIEGVDGQKPERRWAIDLHVIVVRAFFSRLSLPIRPANVHSASASRMLAGRMSKSCSSVLFASAMETLPARTSKTVCFSVCGSRAQIFAQVPPSVQIEQQYLFFGIPGKLNTWIMRVVVLPMPPFGFAIAR